MSERAFFDDDTLALEATNVTGSRTYPFEVPGSMRAEDVAHNLAQLMSLPSNVPWGIRDDATARYLAPDQPIREQLAPGARVTVTPRTHLG